MIIRNPFHAPDATSRDAARYAPYLSQTRAGERGYTLLALLMMMTVLAITLTAAAPILRQQAQRERELEAIRRGEEVAEAIRLFYVNSKPNRLPNSIDELIEGVPTGRTKKRQVLRNSAARDPLTGDEWVPVRVNDSQWRNFVAEVTKYNGGKPPIVPPPLNTVIPMTVPVTGLGESPTITTAPNTSGLSGGFIVGVASRSRNRSVVTYYGIEEHKNWVFTPAFR